MRKLEPGLVLALDGAIALIDREVFAVTIDDLWIKIGVIPWENVSWFNVDIRYKILENATQIVFIEDGVFGLKHMTEPVDEFMSLDRASQDYIIEKYFEFIDEKKANE